MELFNEFMSQYGLQIIYTLLTAAAAWIGKTVAKYYKRWVNTREKEQLAKTVVTAVEQIYQTLHGAEKFAKAYEALSEMLAEREIHISDLEIKMLIEAAVGEANKAFEREKAREDEPAADEPEQITILEGDEE